MVRRQLREIMAANPDNINPSDGISCLYHQGRGRNIRRCLIGQWAWEQGFKTPAADEGDASELVADLWSNEAEFTPAAVSVLFAYQGRADDWGTPEPSPVPWGSLL